MPTYLTPGVYVEEIPSGSMPLEAVGTAVAAFVGFTAKAPTDDLEKDPKGLRPRMVTSWTQYKNLYGGFSKDAFLPHAVYGYFRNGGARCYIVRISNRESDRQPLEIGGAKQGLEFINISDDENLIVEIRPSGQAGSGSEGTQPTPGEQPEDSNSEPGDQSEDSNSEPGDQSKDSSSKPSEQASPAATKSKPALYDVVVMRDPAPAAEAAEGATGTTSKKGGKKGEQAAAGEGADQPKEIDRHEKVTIAPGPRNIVTVINQESDLIEIVGSVADASLPAATTVKLSKPTPNAQLKASTFSADEETPRSGVEGLSIAEDVTMVIVPDLAKFAKDDEDWKKVQGAVIDHCKSERNRMAILDTPPDLDAQRVEAWRDACGYDSAFATMYYPWIKVDNPVGTNGDSSIFVPPSGHIAGIWARNDETRGVWKAPANETVNGAIDLQERITSAEQEILNPEGINAIRAFGSRGIKVWGARTLSMTDPSWKYINVRRLFNMVEATIMEGTQWVVFEPNDQALWQRVNRTVSSFLLGLWRQGALFGTTPEEAFFVKCDEELNPPESRDEGKLIVEVGIAPVKPAEFVIFRISQKAQETA